MWNCQSASGSHEMQEGGTTMLDKQDTDPVHRIGDMQDFSRLDVLRMEDFERSQLHKLRVESRAVLFWTNPGSFFRLMRAWGKRSIKRLAGKPLGRWPQERVVIWHTHDAWYQTAWLGFQPFLFWFINFLAGIPTELIYRPSVVLQSMRKSIVSWLYLVILTPVLLLLSTISNIVTWMFPESLPVLREIGVAAM